jgi:hypothetical protein
MEYHKLDPDTDHLPVELHLILQDIKVLHNACVDITNQYPEMVGYERIREKLEFYIKDTLFEHENPTY